MESGKVLTKETLMDWAKSETTYKNELFKACLIILLGAGAVSLIALAAYYVLGFFLDSRNILLIIVYALTITFWIALPFVLLFLVIGIVARLLDRNEKIIHSGKYLILKCRHLWMLEYTDTSGEMDSVSSHVEFSYHNDTCVFTHPFMNCPMAVLRGGEHYALLEKKRSVHKVLALFPIGPEFYTGLSEELQAYYVDAPVKIRMSCPSYYAKNSNVKRVDMETE